LIIGLEASKVDNDRYRKDQIDARDRVDLAFKKLDEVNNQQKALQNWVEKYEPLKIQH
jgi:hypothetical protein